MTKQEVVETLRKKLDNIIGAKQYVEGKIEGNTIQQV